MVNTRIVLNRTFCNLRKLSYQFKHPRYDRIYVFDRSYRTGTNKYNVWFMRMSVTQTKKIIIHTSYTSSDDLFKNGAKLPSYP